MKNIKLNFLQLSLIVVITGVMMSFVTGSLVYKNLSTNGKVTTTNNKYVNQFIKTYNKLLEGYYEDLDENKLVDAAIKGMLSYAGDDYTIYLDEDATESLNDKLDGTYQGIGIRISLNDNNEIYIYEVFDDSPAKKAGLLENDILLGIDDVDLVGKSTEEASSIIQNSKKNKFNIKIKRNDEIMNFEIERTSLIVPAITSKIKEVNNKKIGYLYLENFSSTLDTQVEKSLLEMEKDGIDSLIIDVRYNTGGYLRSCTNIINLFLEKDKLMYSIKSKTSEEKFKDDTDTKRDYPIVVLVNGSSASASEILAGALKYSYGATIIGTKTYGKGKVQSTGTLDDGTMIKYTTAKWYLPNGECIDEKGILPDIEVELSDEYKKNPNSENDNQLNTAIKKLSE